MYDLFFFLLLIAFESKKHTKNKGAKLYKNETHTVTITHKYKKKKKMGKKYTQIDRQIDRMIDKDESTEIDRQEWNSYR